MSGKAEKADIAGKAEMADMAGSGGGLSFGAKCGYGSAAVGDAVSYMFVTTFVMFFLTTIAGIQPAVAGTLTGIAAVWDAFVNPVIGYISDNARTRWGRRRPFMIGFCPLIIICLVLLFTAVDMPYTVKVIYYGFMIIAFWTSFTGFFVPYYALGAEYTRDYDERSTLRSFASFFNMIGTLFSMAMPTMIVQLLSDSGLTEARAWQMTALFLGIVTAVSIVITFFASKDRDVCSEGPGACSESPDIMEKDRDSREAGDTEVAKPAARETLSLRKMFGEYLEVLKLGPMRWLLLTSLFYLTGYGMIMSDLVYLLTFNLGFSGSEVSLAMVVRSLIIIVFIPVINKLATATDKRTAQMAILVFGIAGIIGMRFMDVSVPAVLAVFIFITAMTTQTYWQLMPAIFYDICEYDEYETGKRREGTILAVQGFVEAAAAGLGAQLLGFVLQFAGFDGTAAVQSETALTWVYNCTTWVPAIFLILAVFTLYKYPITKARYREILEALNERRG